MLLFVARCLSYENCLIIQLLRLIAYKSIACKDKSTNIR